MGEIKLPFIQHLTELRRRLTVIVIAILVGATICFFYVEKFLDYVIKPAKGLDFVYLSPPELFLAFLKISLVAGICLTSPLILLQIWLFIRPALERREKIMIFLSFFAGIIFFFLGGLFAYTYVLPLTIDFFVKLSVPGIEPMFSFGSYVGFISSVLLAFGLVFELPMVVVLLTQLNIISAKTLKKFRKPAILIIFIVAAVLTPPDVVSQLLLAGPMLLLFEISILLSSLIGKRKAKRKKALSA